jgi:hypothetical protein
MSTQKKKRGRKPKNKIILNENPVFENTDIDNILITCIKKQNDNINITGEDQIDFNDEENKNYEEVESEKIHKCWNCSYKIEGEIYSYPISYHNNLFNVNGDFCCYECASRYIYENYTDSEFQDKYYLLNLYTNLRSNSQAKINIPLSRLRLIDYGGDLTKEEYINSKNITYDCYIPPIVYINNSYYNKDIINNKNTEFKLFRKKKKEMKFLNKYES